MAEGSAVKSKMEVRAAAVSGALPQIVFTNGGTDCCLRLEIIAHCNKFREHRSVHHRKPFFSLFSSLTDVPSRPCLLASLIR